jgi:hypothetical protein
MKDRRSVAGTEGMGDEQLRRVGDLPDRLEVADRLDLPDAADRGPRRHGGAVAAEQCRTVPPARAARIASPTTSFPPGRFSTTIVAPSARPKGSATRRAEKSVPPPAGDGTTSVMVLPARLP